MTRQKNRYGQHKDNTVLFVFGSLGKKTCVKLEPRQAGIGFVLYLLCTLLLLCILLYFSKLKPNQSLKPELHELTYNT